jgi:hypothetical protein
MTEQIDRIKRMESVFDYTLGQVMKMSELINDFGDITKSIRELQDYYESVDWKKDYADDESKLLPDDLKRGVLSEDGLWNLLAEWSELERKIKEISMRC